MACVLCHGAMVVLFRARDYRRPRDRTEHAIEWCHRCRYGRVAGAHRPDEVGEFYAIPYYTHGQLPDKGPPPSFLDRLRLHVAWRFDKGVRLSPGELAKAGLRPGATICDLGCGGGELIRDFAAAGFQVIGVEPDPAARATAQRFGEVLAGTAENLPLELSGRRFEAVVLSHVLEHCIDPVRAVVNARGLLEKGGRLVIEVPNNAAAGFRMFGACWPWTDVPRHLHFFTEISLRKILQSIGMSTAHVDYVGYARQFGNDWLETQERIWTELRRDPAPRFGAATWRLLARTALASRATKYDSVRVHAVSP